MKEVKIIKNGIIKFMCLVKTRKYRCFLVKKMIHEDYGEFGGCRLGETKVNFPFSIVEQEAGSADLR